MALFLSKPNPNDMYLSLTLMICIFVLEIHALVMEGLRNVMANAVSLRKTSNSVATDSDTWSSSNLCLNTRPRVKRGGGM